MIFLVVIFASFVGICNGGINVNLSGVKKLENIVEYTNQESTLQQGGAFVVEYQSQDVVIDDKSYGPKKVIVFGSLHTSYDQGIPFQMIRKAIAGLPEDAYVLYEAEAFVTQLAVGKQVSKNEYFQQIKSIYEPTWWQKKKQLLFPLLPTEMGLTNYLATNKNLVVECADVPYDQLMTFLKKIIQSKISWHMELIGE